MNWFISKNKNLSFSTVSTLSLIFFLFNLTLVGTEDIHLDFRKLNFCRVVAIMETFLYFFILISTYIYKSSYSSIHLKFSFTSYNFWLKQNYYSETKLIRWETGRINTNAMAVTDDVNNINIMSIETYNSNKCQYF